MITISNSTRSGVAWLGLTVALLAPGAAFTSDDPPEPAGAPAGDLARGIARLEADPAALVLAGRFAHCQLLVTGVRESGERVDLTRAAAIEAPQGLISISERGLVRSRANGEGEVSIRAGGLRLRVPVRVRDHDAPYQPSFVRDVMPILSRLGCTSGLCHGSAKGKNGFKLSIRGNDPAFDHRALTDDLKGRRFNRAAPERSLFLMKIRGEVPHQGGVRTRPGEPYYGILEAWVRDGVRLDLDTPRVERIEVLPRDPSLARPGDEQQMKVVATYADGSTRDVTAEAFVETSDTEVTSVDEEGLVKAIRRGEAAILARYEGRYAATRLVVMGDRDGFEWKDVPENNWIDALVDRKLRRVKTLPGDLASDAEFLRRVSLDLTGTAPTPRDVRTFLADRRDSRLKREELIDRLIGSTEFVEYWTNKWADLLQVRTKLLGREGVAAYRGWIRQAVASNLPYDEFVRALLTSSGSTLQNPPASFYKVLREPGLVMESATQLFLGIRFNCNKCHDHPFERWTQNDHWRLAAYFGRVGRKNAPGARVLPRKGGNQPGDTAVAVDEIIRDLDKGEVKTPGGQVALASVPYTFAGWKEPEGANRREVLAAWLTSAKNPYFARSFANRIWSYFLGIGLIDPVDDIRAGNPPSNPELLDRLTAELVESGFDVRSLMRAICRSRTYQLSVQTNRWNEDDRINYSHALARRLPAEVLYDAIYRATGSRERLPGMRSGSRAVEIADPSTKLADGFLDLFGRPPRESPCECERSTNVSFGQALNLINGPTLANAVRDPENAISDLLRVEKRPDRLLEELYLSILCRPPSEEEKKALSPSLDPRAADSADALAPEDAKVLAERLAAWEKRQRPATWTPVEMVEATAGGGARLEALEAGVIAARDGNPEKTTYTLKLRSALETITALRLEALPADDLPAKGPGRAENGNFVLGEITLSAAASNKPEETRPVRLVGASADFSQKDWPVERAADGKPETGWAVSPRFGQRHVAVFQCEKPIAAKGGALLEVKLVQPYGSRHTLGRFRISCTATPRPVGVSRLPDELLAALAVAPEERTPEQRGKIFETYVRGDRDMEERIRLAAARDLAWALLNSPAFLFNR